MQPIDPLAVAAVRLGTSAQLVGVARIDQEHLEALRLEQLVQSDPVDARRLQGDGGDLMLMQEGRNGFQASRMGRNSRIKPALASVLKPTQTQWEREPTSMPAACGCCTGSASSWTASC